MVDGLPRSRAKGGDLFSDDCSFHSLALYRCRHGRDNRAKRLAMVCWPVHALRQDTKSDVKTQGRRTRGIGRRDRGKAAEKSGKGQAPIAGIGLEGANQEKDRHLSRQAPPPAGDIS